MATMDWTYPESNDEGGIFEIGRRLTTALGRVPDVTRFSYDPREMMRTTRQIERAARGHRLLTGFQTAAKLSVETERYADLLEAGTAVTVFATGAKPTDPRLARLDYRELSPSTRALANQWFLVAEGPEPLVFVSYEIGDDALFGVGGAATPGKRFVGFVTDDPGVVELISASLSNVYGVTPPAPPAPPAPSAAAAEIAASIDAVAESDTLTTTGAVIVAIGRGDDRRAFLRAAAIARHNQRAMVIVDRSAEGFSSPYGDMRGDDASRPSPLRLVNEATARREGRNALGLYLEAARAAGLEAGGWFPNKSGGDGLAEAIRLFSGAAVVLPPEAASPSLAERLRGMGLENLTRLLARPVLIAR